MKKLLIAAGLALAFAVVPQAYAGKQQNRMKECNAEAGDKKGADRKSFMKSCLSEKAAAAKGARTAQQEKMKTCNVEAKGKKGAERKDFMKSCLSK